MVPIQRILCPIDFSASSALAFDYAQSAAWHYSATVWLQHVVESLRPYLPYNYFPDAYDEICRTLRAEAVKQLQGFAKSRNSRGVPVQCTVQDGNIADLILDVAEDRAVDLIVLGTHGLRGTDHLALGSVTEKVLRKARCLVLAVREAAYGGSDSTGAPGFVEAHRVICCTDFSETSEQVLDKAISVAATYGAELTLLHVLEGTSRSSDIETETKQVLQRLEQQIPFRGCPNLVIQPAVRIGKPYQQIIELALESQTDVIVMGARGTSAFDLAVFGSVTHRVVQSGPCPVLVVHTTKDPKERVG